MISKNLSARGKIQLLLILCLVWITIFRFYFLPAITAWNEMQITSDLTIAEDSGEEMDYDTLKAEVTDLEKKLNEISKVRTSTLSVSDIHSIVSEMNTACGGKILEIKVERLEDPSSFSLSFLWQGEYYQWLRSLVFLQELPWMLEHEQVLLKTIDLNDQSLLQWNFQCTMDQNKGKKSEARSIHFIEGGRNPFEIK